MAVIIFHTFLLKHSKCCQISSKLEAESAFSLWEPLWRGVSSLRSWHQQSGCDFSMFIDDQLIHQELWGDFGVSSLNILILKTFFMLPHSWRLTGRTEGKAALHHHQLLPVWTSQKRWPGFISLLPCKCLVCLWMYWSLYLTFWWWHQMLTEIKSSGEWRRGASRLLVQLKLRCLPTVLSPSCPVATVT